MSYQERRSLVHLFGSIVVTSLYGVYMSGRYPDVDPYTAEMFHFWGTFFLLLIPVSIVAKIIINIIFSIINTIITQHEEPLMMDERDKLIELKALRNSLYLFGIGVIVAMGSLVWEMSPSFMFLLLFMAGFIADLVGDLSQFYFYRRGY